jgi:hypothetical protein
MYAHLPLRRVVARSNKREVRRLLASWHAAGPSTGQTEPGESPGRYQSVGRRYIYIMLVRDNDRVSEEVRMRLYVTEGKEGSEGRARINTKARTHARRPHLVTIDFRLCVVGLTPALDPGIGLPSATLIRPLMLFLLLLLALPPLATLILPFVDVRPPDRPLPPLLFLC